MKLILSMVCLLTILARGQTPYSHPIITVQNPHYITQLSQATNTDTNVVKSSTTLGGSYLKKNGTSAKHIVIVNEGGPVIMTGGMEIDDCTYLDIIGWGSSDAYGFQFLNGSSPQPVHIVGKCSNITIKGYKLIGGTNGGIWAKTEVSEVSSRYNCDLSYLSTPMLNINLSCNWLENCGGEAYYIGSTGWKGDRPMVCGGVTTYPVPQKVGYIHCDSNIIINAGRTGAQMSGSIPDADNYGTFRGNKVYNPGRGLESNQGVGLSIGGNFRNPTVTGNEVHTSYNYNYYITGYDNVIFDNNLGDSSGYWKNTKNPEKIPGIVFATSVSPTTWKIRNNVEGYNSSVPSTGYAIYPSAKNTDTGNVICNNVGDYYVLNYPLIYSNTCSVTNIPPTANAGSNATITLPVNTYQLNGSASDIDGVVSSTLWTKLSGPTYTISDATILNPVITNLLAGTYKFILTATDNDGATAADTMRLTVNAAPVNNAPVVDAGIDITIQLPTSTTQLNATATDDGTITTIAWTQIAGTAATISNAAILNPNITGLTTSGNRTFRIIVTDNGGLKDTDDVNVNVLPAPNVPPVVGAGNDTTINLPSTTVNLNGTASDADGTISSTLWSNTDGCSITSASSLTTTATCTIPGTHIFILVATDNQSATTQDQMTATMVAAANVPPTITHRNDTTLYLPQDSLLMTIVASDVDGTIANRYTYIIQTLYTAKVSREATANPSIKSFDEGDTIIVVRRVTDDDSAYGFDTTRIYVLDTTNNAPNARINKDTITYLDPPLGQISIDGSGSFDNDNGDFIAGYFWEQTSGAAATLTGTTTSMLHIDDMVPGVYGYRLTVTDSKGLTDFINFTITVTAKLKYEIKKIKTSGPSLIPEPPPAAEEFKQGFNTNSADSSQRMKNSGSNWATIKTVNDNYNTKFIRYPGGTNSLTYFPDTLGRIAQRILFDFFTIIGDTDHMNQYNDPTSRYKIYDYQQFLTMANSMLFTPVIVLNNQFYRDGDSIYLLENLVDKVGTVYSGAGGLHPDRWTVATDSLINQVNFTHSIYPGVVYWELGNECYARMSAVDYVETVTIFLNTIHALYPNDKFIASISKGDYQHNPVENDQWNHDIINLLNSNGKLHQINFFAPHFYWGFSDYKATEQELIDRMNARFFENVYSYLINDAGFPFNYNPSFFYTEYGVSGLATGLDINPGTNTQYHALLQLDMLMKFHSKNNIAGCLSHTWTNPNNGSFYDSTEAQKLGYIPTARHDNAYFAYITPQAIADSLFMSTTGKDVFEGLSTLVLSQYRVCISQTNGTTYTQILNFTDAVQNYTLTGGAVNWTAVQLPDLNSHDWNVTANLSTGTASGTLSLPARSFVYFNE